MIRLSKIKVSDFSQWSFFFLSLHMNCSVCLISCFFCHLRWDWMLPDLSKVLGLLCNQCKVHSGFSMLALWNEFIHKVVRKWQTREVWSGTRLKLRWMFLKGGRLHVLTCPHQTWPWSPGEVEWKSPDRQSFCFIQWYILTVLLTLSLGQNQKVNSLPLQWHWYC